MRVLSVLLACGLGGCAFSPAVGDGAFACAQDRSCPPDFVCALDGRCHHDAFDGAAASLPDAAAAHDLAEAPDLSRPGMCMPRSCALAGLECGTAPDGCGGMVDCGNPDCKSGGGGGGNKCGGGGPNLCGNNNCQKTSCQMQGKNCGFISDGCAAVIPCGLCPAFHTCGGGGVPNVCG